MPRLKLDPTSPSGVSVVTPPQTVVRSQGGGYVAKVQYLDELQDVDLSTSPTDNQALAWDSATQKWIPQTISGGGGGSSDWGDIGGTLSNQTDLQAALDDKADITHSHNKLEDEGIEVLATRSDSNFDSGVLYYDPTDPTTFMNNVFPAGFGIYGNVGVDGNGDWDRGIAFGDLAGDPNNATIYTPAGGKVTHNGDELALKDYVDTGLGGKQPLDSDLTALAAANNSTVLAATTASFLTADETKLDGIEALADVTDDANVKAAMDGMTLTDVGTPASGDRILLQDASDSNNMKYAAFSEFGGGGGTGNVVGPASATDNAIAIFDGTSGELLRNDSNFKIDDLGNMTAPVLYAQELYVSDGVTPDYAAFVDGDFQTQGAVRTDTINEFTAGAGVTVDGVLIKDGEVDGIDLGAITATETELNYTDGVTSAIQTQLDGKQPLDSDLTTIAGLTPTTDNFMVATSSAWASRTPTQARSQMGLGSLATASTINDGNWSGTDLSVANGGTGASTLTGLLQGNGTSAITGGATINDGNWSGTDLSVANGGTGVSTLGSGNVLVGAGTSAVTSTKAAPSGDFVGTSDSQALSNKTLTDPVVNQFGTASGLGAAYSTWSPSFTGFSANPASGLYYYKQVGKTVILHIRMPNSGTSNATGFTISLPVTAANITGMIWSSAVTVTDNGTNQTTPGLLVVDVGISTTAIQVYRNSALAAFTNSGNKRVVFGSLVYEAA